MKEQIFVDAGFWIALIDPDDQYRKQAMRLIEIQEEEKWQLLTTDFVTDETYTGLLTRAGYYYAMIFDKRFEVGAWECVFIDKSQFLEARNVFARFNKDKKWSFTDCASYVVMKQLKVRKVLTFDEHFGEMGFEVMGK